jgi:hypothetical protein
MWRSLAPTVEICWSAPGLQPPSKERRKRLEIDVRAANKNADAFFFRRPVGAAEKRCQGRGAAWFGHHGNLAPQPALRLDDRCVGDKDRIADEAPRYGEVESADAGRAK